MFKGSLCLISATPLFLLYSPLPQCLNLRPLWNILIFKMYFYKEGIIKIRHEVALFWVSQSPGMIDVPVRCGWEYWVLSQMSMWWKFQNVRMERPSAGQRNKLWRGRAVSHLNLVGWWRIWWWTVGVAGEYTGVTWTEVQRQNQMWCGQRTVCIWMWLAYKIRCTI